MTRPCVILVSTILCQLLTSAAGLLYPKESESREVKPLNGIWNFRLSPPLDYNRGYAEKWYSRALKDSGPVIPMPVPASYNDVTVDKKIRDHVGIVWYDTTFFAPYSWRTDRKVWLRFGSVCYAAQVWVNGQLVLSHEIGHLPFETEIGSLLRFGGRNMITVAVDNTLLQTSVPQGNVNVLSVGNSSMLRQTYTFDFFNYAGIDRPVFVYTTPITYIQDITVIPSIEGNGAGKITYRIDYNADYNTSVMCNVRLMDREGIVVAASNECLGNVTVNSPNLWWPYLMSPEPGYLYSMKVELRSGRSRDVYRLKVGIRTVSWSDTQMFINRRPIYIRGVGKHEDSDIRGKGLDHVINLRDFELMKWLGVNTFRTSHYPYSEEIMDLADEMGIMVIDECPSVDTDLFSMTLLEKHQNSLTELIRRDKNRPSVIMWSAANEPRSHHPAAEGYFKRIVEHIKSLDTTRPVTIAISRSVNDDKAAQFLDIICFNRYNSWYQETGLTEVIYDRVVKEATAWHEKFRLPIIMSEYGADAYPGLHLMPERVWSEEYQEVVLEQQFRAFDRLRKMGFFIGEMVWNFADFSTAQTTSRVGGNKKGVFTRQREPKAAAFLLRARYNELANELDGAPLPKNLYRYTSSAFKHFNENECSAQCE